jgi:hypothetical protein
MSMLTPEQRAFLMEQVRTAKLATVRKDGRPLNNYQKAKR